MIKRLSLLLLFVCSTANAQFVTGQILTAQQLNNAFANVLALSGGTLAGPLTVPTMTVTGNLTVNGTFTLNGGLSPSSLAPQAANTVIANVTASTASPTAVALPSCSTANSALKYTSATGFSCGTTYALTSGTLAQFAATTSAQLAGIVSDETGSGSLVFGTSPTISGATISGGTISSTPISGSTGSFTTLAASGAVSGAGFTNLFASPPAIGGTAANTGAFTTLSASSTVSGTGFSTYLASPPAIGGTAPAAGKFTTLQATSTVTGIPGRLIGIQVFSATGTYTPTSGTTQVLVRVQGAGGAGGGTSATASTTVAAAAGGAGGAYAEGLITSGFSGVTVTVGTGGTGVSGANGNAGGASSFGASISAPGGPGGGLSGAAVPPFITSAGPNSSLATGASIFNGNGAAGGNGLALSTAILQSGAGAASLFGPGGAPRVNTTSTGQAGGNPGAGGSGAIALTSQAAQTGGAGANGFVIVYEYQ